MGDIVKGPMRFHHRRVMTADEIYRQQEPPEQMVWDMCALRRGDLFAGDRPSLCEACPRFRAGTRGVETPLCYEAASAACKLVSAWWMRDQWLKRQGK